MDALTPGGTTISIREQLLADRKNLLDLGTRNRLINIPMRSKNIRTIEIVDEKSVEVFRILHDGRAMTFLPGRALTDEEKAELASQDETLGGIPQPDDEDVDDRGMARRHSDTRLQTRLTSEGLQKRLFDVWYDSRTLEEEQGVNVLYLAIGLVKWFEDDKSEVERHAPLVLMPVKLERTSASDRFSLRTRGEALSTNLSLQAKLNGEFGIKLPDIPEDDDVDIAAYIASVAEAVAAKTRWTVLSDAMILGFFSFSKFLMYRDLDPDNWPKEGRLDEHPVISGLLRDGFPYREPIVPEYGRIDAEIPPQKMNHIVEADSSQSIVVEESSRGHHMVVKGPPGTGKSQTITNIIAAAVAEGKRVLFVAEKMAALDVVHRRLRDAGLGALALQLHSNKATKKSVLEELRKTKEVTPRPPRVDTTTITRLSEVQDTMNGHADMMHVPDQPSGITPFVLVGNLVKALGSGGESGYKLSDALVWTPADFRKRAETSIEIADRLGSIGSPPNHPWYGVERDAPMPEEAERLPRQLSELRELFDGLSVSVSHGSALIEAAIPETFGETGRLVDLIHAIATFPGDRDSVVHPLWSSVEPIRELVSEGLALFELQTRTDAAFTENAWDADLTGCRNAIAMHGGSLFRIFNGSYRAQIAILTSYLKGQLPKTQGERVALVDMIISAQKRRRAIDTRKELGAPAFGSQWNGERSDWETLQRVVDWNVQNAAILSSENRIRVSNATDIASLEQAARAIALELDTMAKAWDAIVQFLKLDHQRAAGSENFTSAGIESINSRIALWTKNPESISKWIAFYERCRVAVQLGLAELVQATVDGKLTAASIRPTFERSYYETLRNDFFEKMPELRRFDGELHGRHVETFRSLELARMSLTREKIVARHAAELPRSNGGIGPLGVLNAELAKRKNHLPIRQLLDRAGDAIQQIKPIFMMSPLSVAQFLRPGSMSFDLLVIDEASQVEPVDALGAVARSKQVIIVGDERQLPPTRFFAKMTSDIEENEDEEDITLRARDAESILDLCLAKGMPDRMLRWHYRSRHQSLIAVSNREFYENRLFIVPSPYDAVAGMGLKFNYLPNAHYDRGNTRTNPIEARAVAEAVIRHARELPDQSLGVATFSVAQRQAVLKELELLRREHPDTEDFFNRSSTEPFFVKNIENIQGDERDVIFISVGYGRTSTGFISMSFGPLNSEGGERRLNVLISRAKLRCEVFSSITGDDIDLDRVKSRGVIAFKLFLTFAQTGKFGFAEHTGTEADSVFEEQVADRLRSLGHDVKGQIGSAGFFIDLAVSDPNKPGRFVLGIECDGAAYHSSRSARDRDRLRQRVLEDHGWIMHRIWSTDWYLRPQEELAKVVAAIEAAKADWQARDEELAKPKQAVPLHFTVEEEADVDVVTAHVAPEAPPLSIPYVKATVKLLTKLEPHEISVAEMAHYVTEVVRAEGPIHESEIVVRIGAAWGLARAGNRIRDAVAAGLRAAVQVDKIAVENEFYTAPGKPVLIRDRTNSSLSLRRIEALPPAEIILAAKAVLRKNFGATREQLITAISRVLGYLSTSPQMRSAIDVAIQAAIDRGEISENEGLLKDARTT